MFHVEHFRSKITFKPMLYLYSTKNKDTRVTLSTALFKGLPDDNGLFMPERIPRISQHFIENLSAFSFQEIAYRVSHTMLQGSIPPSELRNLIEKAINFPAPVVKLNEQTHVLELFHGPSLAFKDFGARFMAQLMRYFNEEATRELVILVATSGDTGGAVAAGFYDTPGIQVVILYPSGKVSDLQEKQLTTLGKNITALEVQGTFDDCQALVKSAFLDSDLTSKIRLSSANSINIARLIPQSFYYFEAFKQLSSNGNPVVFSVPSGNFGNLTAGLFAKKMGLPIHQFIAATNANDVVPQYLHTGKYTPRPSVSTLSNAMDVGNPSNFARMNDICSTWNMMRDEIVGYAFDDTTTEKAVREVAEKYDYTIDPHGALGYLAFREYQKQNPNAIGVILETAHPAKFLPDMERILGHEIDVPQRLAELSHKEKQVIEMDNDFQNFKSWLLQTF
jgi:threonine synthase